jgi:hypothetical protein
MHSLHKPIPSDEKRCGPSIEIYSLGQLISYLTRVAGQEHSVLQAIPLDKRTQPLRIGQLVRLLEVKGDNF